MYTAKIFGAEPIASDVRKAGTGGTDKYTALDNIKNGAEFKKLHERLDNLSSQSKNTRRLLQQIN